eukprot:c16660_g1_i2.p1 GENE.c16660_g1_i2~~c16660_g1_i2.p1  ORF type:complete len:488 (+),score=109.78 c16660_g1_i2:39-1502(+)
MAELPRRPTQGDVIKARVEAVKAQRVQNFMKLRKEKRQSNFAKRRKRGTDTQRDTDEVIQQAVEGLLNAYKKGASSAVKARVEALRTVRRILSGDDSNVDRVVACPGVMDVLFKCLSTGGAEEKHESVWCLTNIASGSSPQARLASAAAPQLITLLGTPDPLLQEQCLWALANIAGDHERDMGDALFVSGVLQPVLHCYASSNPSVSQCAAWTLCNLLRGRFGLYAQAMTDYGPTSLPQTLIRLFRASELPEQLRLETLWLLTYLTNGTDAINEHLTRIGLIGFVCAGFQLVAQNGASDELLIPCARVLGNMTSIGPLGAAAVYSTPATSVGLVHSLASLRSVIVKESCWALSNILAGSDIEIAPTLSIDGILPRLVDLLSNASFDVKRETAYCIANICSNGRHIDTVVRAGATSGFIALLHSPDPDVVHVSLSFVEMVLLLVDRGALLVEELEGVAAIESLISNQHFSERAGKIMDKYFSGVEQED